MRRLLTTLLLGGVIIGAAGLAQPLPLPSVPLFADADAAAVRSAAVPPEQVGTVRTRLAQLDPLAATQLRGGALSLNLFDDATFMAVGGVRQDGGARGAGSTVWKGTAAGVPQSNVILTTDGHGNVDLRVLMLGRNYFVQSLGGGLVRISEIDPSAGRYDASGQPVQDAVEVAPDEAEQRTAADNRASPRADDGSVIDVMVVYTPAAVAMLGSEPAARLAIEAAAELANTTFENSGVDLRLRLVHLALVEYVEQGGNDLGRLSGSTDGYMDEVHQWRNQYQADLVALVPGTAVEDRNYCGIANLPFVMPAPGAAFSITEALCISDITFAHELGHNMGKAHDHANGSFAIHPYAFGYQDTSTGPGDYGDWVTVMAYSTFGQCPTSYIPGVCPAVAWWSDNEATYQGKPLGSPGVNGEDNEQSLGETALQVANYRLSSDGGATTPTPQPTLTPIPTPGGSGQAMPLNGSFEFDNDGNGTPDGWVWGSVGTLKCGGNSSAGDCALVLKKGAALKQNVPMDFTGLGPGDSIDVSFDIYAKSVASCGKAVMKAFYANPAAGAGGNGKDKLVLPLPVGPALAWVNVAGSLVLDDAPTKLTLAFKTGKTCRKGLRIDSVAIE